MRYLYGEYGMNDVEELVSVIEKFGNARGEVSAKWVKGIEMLLQKSEGMINVAATIENLRTLLDRAQRGEFIVCFGFRCFRIFDIG